MNIYEIIIIIIITTGIVPTALIGITVTFMFNSVFSSLAKTRYLSLFSVSFIFTPWSACTAKSTFRQVLYFLLFFGFRFLGERGRYYHKFLARWGDYSFVSQNFERLIRRDGFWVVHMPLVRIVKFKFFARFPVDHIPHPVMSCLKCFLV